MLVRNQLHDYQNKAVEHIKTHPRSMLWLDLGLGKTVSSLTAASDMMNSLQVYGVLVLAPLRVCQTVWGKEARNWEHTQHLRFNLVHGKEPYRKWMVGRSADFYLVNYEGVQWAVDEFITQYLNKGKPLPFNMIICDEVTKLKSSRVQEGGKWGQYLQQLLPYIPYRVGLTGTPAPNGLKDLFGQYLILDDGERLGRVHSTFMNTYFKSDRMGYKHEITREGERFIHQAVSDITIEMAAEDYLKLPENRIHTITVKLPDRLQQQYDKLEREMFLELDSGATIDPDNAATAMGKCLQFASGAVYTHPEDRTQWDIIHKLKIDALVDAIEELNGEPLLLGYQFKHDAERIKKRFDKEKINYVHFDSKIKGSEAQQLEEDWNNGKYAVMLGHGQSIGHGLNLQYGCAYVGWFGLPWSLEIFKQFNGRVIKRQGQKRKTTMIQILTESTVDFAVLEAQERKAATEDDLRTAVNTYRKSKGV
jgi:SNF2 family DNA or RNA helicase